MYGNKNQRMLFPFVQKIHILYMFKPVRELRRLGEKPVGRKTFGRQARTVPRQQIGWLGDIVQTVGRNVWKRRKSKLVMLSYNRCAPVRD